MDLAMIPKSVTIGNVKHISWKEEEFYNMLLAYVTRQMVCNQGCVSRQYFFMTHE